MMAYMFMHHIHMLDNFAKVGFNGSIPEDMENHLPEYMGRLLKSRYRPICKLQSRTYIDYGR